MPGTTILQMSQESGRRDCFQCKLLSSTVLAGVGSYLYYVSLPSRITDARHARFLRCSSLAFVALAVANWWYRGRSGHKQ